MRRAVKARCRAFAVSGCDSPDSEGWMTSSPPGSGRGACWVSCSSISQKVVEGEASPVLCGRWSLIELIRYCLGLKDSALRPILQAEDWSSAGHRPRRLCRATELLRPLLTSAG